MNVMTAKTLVLSLMTMSPIGWDGADDPLRGEQQRGFLERTDELGACEHHAEPEVDAVAERQVPVRAAGRVELLRLSERGFVVVR
jgi:hypothetical protein